MNVYLLLLAGHALLSQPPISPGGKGDEIDKADLRVCCEKIKQEGQRTWFLYDRNGKMKLQIRGIYVHGSAMFFQLTLNNRSPRDYAIDSVRFQVLPKDRGRLAGERSRRLEPVYIHDSSSVVPGYTRITSIFVLPRIVMPSGSQLSIDMLERNGARHLHIQITNWTLARARLI